MHHSSINNNLMYRVGHIKTVPPMKYPHRLGKVTEPLRLPYTFCLSFPYCSDRLAVFDFGISQFTKYTALSFTEFPSELSETTA